MVKARDVAGGNGEAVAGRDGGNLQVGGAHSKPSLACACRKPREGMGAIIIECQYAAEKESLEQSPVQVLKFEPDACQPPCIQARK